MQIVVSCRAVVHLIALRPFSASRTVAYVSQPRLRSVTARRADPSLRTAPMKLQKHATAREMDAVEIVHEMATAVETEMKSMATLQVL